MYISFMVMYLLMLPQCIPGLGNLVTYVATTRDASTIVGFTVT